LINFFKNKFRRNKIQIELNEEILKKYPSIYRGIFKRSKYKHIFASIGLVIGMIILLSYNYTYKGYIANTTSVYFVDKHGKFKVDVKENGILRKMDLYPFFKNYGDSFMFYTEIKDSVVNIETDWNFRISFLLSKNYNPDDIFGNIILVNFDFDSISIAKLKKNVGEKLIILNKKHNWEEKSIYIVYKDDFNGDIPVFEYGKLFILLKSFPYGLKIVSFEKERL